MNTTKPDAMAPVWTAVDFLTGAPLSETTTKRKAANQAKRNHPGRGFGMTALDPKFVHARRTVLNAAAHSSKPWAMAVTNRAARATVRGTR